MSNIEVFRSLVDRTITNIEIPNFINNIRDYAFNNCHSITNLTIPNNIKKIGAYSLVINTITDLVIPSSVNFIGAHAFYYLIKTITFKQPYGMEVTLPTAGSTNGLLYDKSARTMSIYTDNETCAGYDYAKDNVTATVLHLDGTAWDKLTTPTLSLNGDILTISGSNADIYEVEIGAYNIRLTTVYVSSTSFNLKEQYEFYKDTFYIKVRGKKEGYINSDYVSIDYTPEF